MKVFYRPEYTMAGHDFDTTRKAGWVADSLKNNPIEGVELVSPKLIDDSAFGKAHAFGYVKAVRNGRNRWLASSNGFKWDKKVFPMVRASNSGIVRATEVALATGEHTGSLSSGLHHARYNEGSGFCTFNGLIIAAQAALAAGARRVAIIDFDAHGGGGTDEMLKIHGLQDKVWHADVSVDAFDMHDGMTGTYEYVTDARVYLEAMYDALDWIPEVDVAIYNAGMDPHEDCVIGGRDGIDAKMLQDREKLVYDWAAERQVPVAFTLAGGYLSYNLKQDQLVDLHRLTVKAAAGV